MNHIISFFASNVVMSKLRASTSATLVVTYFLASSATPLYAQTIGNQAGTLLEVQELRQEVAQLRDMVERQQYELRKMQRSLQTNNTRPVTTPQTQPLRGNVINQQLSSGSAVDTLPLLNDQVPEPNLASTSLSGAIDASAVPSAPTLGATQIQNIPNAVTTENANVVTESAVQAGSAVTQSSGRSYPPVVEIAVGSAVPKPQVPATQAVPLNDSLISTSAVTNQQVSTIGNQAVQLANQGVSEVVPTAGADLGTISVVDIKPIETINAGSIVSIPSVATSSAPSAVAVVSNQSASTNQAFNVISENDYYQQGFGLLKESKHAEAVSVFQQQIKSYPQGERADDAYYWIAESMYVNRKLDFAKENFKAIVQGYPKSERLPDAMLRLAYIEQEQGNIIEARILLQEIMQFHPNSDAALSAKNRLSELN